MESVVHLDTHVVIWLYAGYTEILSQKAKTLIEKNTLLISPMVVLELSYLHETKRLEDKAQQIVNDLQDRIDLKIDATPLALVVDQALQMSWTRDPFDRLITAQAASYDRILLSKDDKIRANYSKAIW